MNRKEKAVEATLKECDTLIIDDGPYCDGGDCHNVIYHKDSRIMLYQRYWGGDHGGDENRFYFKKGKISHLMSIGDRAIYANGNPFGAVLGTEYDTAWVYFVNGDAVAFRRMEELYFKDDSLFDINFDFGFGYLETVMPYIDSIRSQRHSFGSKATVQYEGVR